MTCTTCWVGTGHPPQKHSYLLYLADENTGRWGRCVIQSECQHDMQEWVEHLASTGSLMVHDTRTDEKFQMDHPRVMHVDEKTAAHIPIVDPVN